MHQRLAVAITMGDPVGVGPEVVAKALSLQEVYEHSLPIVIGDYSTMNDAVASLGSVQSVRRIRECSEAVGTHGVIDLIDPANGNHLSLTAGCPSVNCTRAAAEYLRIALDLAHRGYVHAVVGGPADENTMHTLCRENLVTIDIRSSFKIAYWTFSHALCDALTQVTEDKVGLLIDSTVDACRALGMENPRVAVMGVNPDPERFPGKEETLAIIPAVRKARHGGAEVFGPTGPYEAFEGMYHGRYDIGIAMYHDQGRFPMKLIRLMSTACGAQWSLSAGIRLVWGLSFPFTTVDHGPRPEVAKRGTASAQSLIEAIKLAVKIAQACPQARHSPQGKGDSAV